MLGRTKPNRTVIKGAYRQDRYFSPHEGKTYIQHSNVYGDQLDGKIQNEVSKMDHFKSDAMKLAAIVPCPPTEQYKQLEIKYGLADKDPQRQRKNWIKFLKSSDGAPYRVIPKNQI